MEDTIVLLLLGAALLLVFIMAIEDYSIMDNYKEIELPQRQWHDGDILVCKRYPNCYAVFKKYKDNDTFETYFVHLNNICNKTVHFDTLEPVRCFHLASAEKKSKCLKLFYGLLNNLDAFRKCLPKKESEE